MLKSEATVVAGVERLIEVGKSSGLENKESLTFLRDLYETLKPHLKKVLEQRVKDRAFIRVKYGQIVGP